MNKLLSKLSALKRYWLLATLITAILFYQIGCTLPPKGVEQTKILKLPSPRAGQPNNILIKFKPGVKPAQRNKILGKQTKRPVKKLRRFAVYKIEVPKSKLPKTLASLKRNKSVEYAELNRKRFAVMTPNDPYYNQQYGLSIINGPGGWDIERGQSNGIKIAIVDTGADFSHPELAGKLTGGWDFVNNNSIAQDDNGHGSHVAGIAAAATNNALGVAGLSWGAQIMPVKVLDSEGSGTDETVSNGITYAVDNGAKVISLSLGGYDFSQTMQNATDYAFNHGVMVLAAAGNDGDGTVIYPAGNSNVIGVAATDSKDKRAYFSNFNSSVDVSAPGVDIISSYIGGGYAYGSGTSMATPFASGLAALVFSQNPSLSINQAYNTVTQNSDDLGPSGWDPYYGFGRINAYNAISGNPAINNFNIAQGSYLRGRKAVRADARDADGIASVRFLVDGSATAVTSSALHSAVIDTRHYSNGAHTFSVKAVDGASHETILNRIAHIDNYRPRTYAPRRAHTSRGGRANLYWKVYDPFTGSRARVKLLIKKRSSRGRRAFYRTVRIVNLGTTRINRLRSLSLLFRKSGVYRFFVYAKDRAGGPQRNVASNYVIVR